MTTRTCDNCNVSYGPDDVFCENCGYDFITGSLPAEGVDGSVAAPSRPAVAAPAPSVLNPDGGTGGGAGVGNGGAVGAGLGQASGTGSETEPDGAAPDGTGELDVPRLRIEVAADRGYFDQVVNEGEIDFPDPPPDGRELELAGRELHIGRTSESRAIHPDIDVAELTGDQAASSRHAVIRVANDGTMTIVDVGSTNGTLLDAVDSEAIIPGVPVAVKPGVPIYLGAWTRLTVLE